jgi:hypothetical protein
MAAFAAEQGFEKYALPQGLGAKLAGELIIDSMSS